MKATSMRLPPGCNQERSMHMNIGEKLQLQEGKTAEEENTYFSLEERLTKSWWSTWRKKSNEALDFAPIMMAISSHPSRPWGRITPEDPIHCNQYYHDGPRAKGDDNLPIFQGRFQQSIKLVPGDPIHGNQDYHGGTKDKMRCWPVCLKGG